MFRFSRHLKIAFVFALIVAGGYLAGRFGFSSNTPPAEFQEARLRGAVVAQDIVNLSNQIGGDLGRVNQFDREGKLKEALILTTDLINKSQEVRSRAVDLSRELEKMTKTLIAVKSTEAQSAALESIANRLTLINHLISYSDYLAQLLNKLQERFVGIQTDGSVEALIKQINDEVAAINSFNDQAGQAMDRFDAIIRK